jgi:hypothetical protein
MKDKFKERYSQDHQVKELAQYVHENFKLIIAKMASEMAKKLDIKGDRQNSEGYVSMVITIQGALFNEMVVSLCSTCQALNLEAFEIVPAYTVQILADLLEGNNPLHGGERTDVVNDIEGFRKYYDTHIQRLRESAEARLK